jgi:hypothetical protein
MSPATRLAPPYGGPGPLTLGQILDRIFKLFRANVALFLQIASLLVAAVIYHDQRLRIDGVSPAGLAGQAL